MNAWLKRAVAVTAVAACLGAAAPASAAVDYFLKIEGVKGESRDLNHKDEITVLSFSWGISETGKGAVGTVGAGKAQPQSLKLRKTVDSASPKLFTISATGDHLKSVVLSLRKAGGNVNGDYLIVRLEDVVVSSVTYSATDGNTPIEEVTLDFAKLVMEYRPTKPDGSFDAVIRAGWDFKSNRSTN